MSRIFKHPGATSPPELQQQIIAYRLKNSSSIFGKFGVPNPVTGSHPFAVLKPSEPMFTMSVQFMDLYSWRDAYRSSGSSRW